MILYQYIITDIIKHQLCVLSKIVMCFLDLESNVKVLALVDSRQRLLSVSGRHFIAVPFRGKEHYSHLVLEAVMASGVQSTNDFASSKPHVCFCFVCC